MIESLRTMQLPIEVVSILHTISDAGFEAYIVGGAVRDLLSDVPTIADFDFTTNATPEQLLELFPESFYENTYGTVSVTPEKIWSRLSISPSTALVERLLPAPWNRPARIIDLASATKIHSSLRNSKESDHDATESDQVDFLKKATPRAFEITTFRSDGVYHDHRRPETVSWGTSLQEDLARRDFTWNAMAIQISTSALEKLHLQSAETWQAAQYSAQIMEDEFTCIDPFNGQSDLTKKVVRTVGNASTRFSEDALRMMRAIRFGVQLNFAISEDIIEAIKEHAHLFAHVSWERIQVEFLKMLASQRPQRAIELLDQTNLLQHILPELLLAKGVEQAGHHTNDVWTHSIDALAHCPSPDPIVRLATLLHDIAKPACLQMMHGKPTFYNHDVVGARMAKKIGERLRLSKKDQNRLFILVRYHMFHYQPENSDASIRRFMRKVGLAHVDDILDLREADRLGSGARKTSWRLEEMKMRMIEQLHQPLDVTDLAINGHDLMSELSMQPGKKIGDVLHFLFEIVLSEPEKNERETLLHLAKEYLLTFNSHTTSGLHSKK